MTTDSKFITNEEGKTLSDRFGEIIDSAKQFDCLVGYFMSSGFHSMWRHLQNAEEIRILIGISTDPKTFGLIESSKKEKQLSLGLSQKEIHDNIFVNVEKEMEICDDTSEAELGVKKFKEWLISGKLQIKVYPHAKIHAKIYITTYKEGGRDKGRVITGSSNFSKSGLQDNLEFNVELKDSPDYQFAIDKFNALWEQSVDISEKYVDFMKNNTWLKENITPYEMFLKFLYENLKERIERKESELNDLPEDFMDLDYQKDAVYEAKSKLEEWGGVFISDVVGLGKTFISAMLAKELEGDTLVLAPPALIDEQNPGSWPNVFFELQVPRAKFRSVGNLKAVLNEGVDRFKNIIIDESHKFRNEMAQMYGDLHKICKSKKVILVSATPLNNRPRDILNQITLFQNAHKSTLPSPKAKNLEKYFLKLEKTLSDLDRQGEKEEYLKVAQKIAKDIRENVLSYLMVRRTRKNISDYYGSDLKKQGLTFPKVLDPQPILYWFDKNMDKIFDETLGLIVNEFQYSRYTPLLFMKKKPSQAEELGQKNMRKFMKILLLKRLESSFFAFKKSIKRFVYSYEKFIEYYDGGKVYVSKKHINKIFEYLERDDDIAIESLVEEGKAQIFSSKDFTADYINSLKKDLKTLKKIDSIWDNVKDDPKLKEFLKILKENKNLKSNRLIVFTESKETAEYLVENIKQKYEPKVILFSGESSKDARKKIINNFDANCPKKRQEKEYRILVTTDVLSEGVSLHRSNVIINYDIPWNPVRMMQRVGRVNRVGKNLPHSEIHTFNFFPASKINMSLGIKEAAEAKIHSFIEMLGNDAKLLTDEEIKSHDLFDKLTSKESITGEDEENPELKYLKLLQKIREEKPELFDRIRKLPKKARCGMLTDSKDNSLLTFFRKGKLMKTFLSSESGVNELDFKNAAEKLEVKENVKSIVAGSDFHELLKINKDSFGDVFQSDEEIESRSGGRSQRDKLIKMAMALQRAQGLTENDEEYLINLLAYLKKGGLAKVNVKKAVDKVNKLSKEGSLNQLKILKVIKSVISMDDFKETYAESSANTEGPEEVILSEYFSGGN
jgi:superfamily II DNA or RNA helicase/HKD family nuclease